MIGIFVSEPSTASTLELPFYRTCEELKDRFYSIQRALMLARSPPDIIAESSLLPAPFPAAYERYRKSKLARVLLRDPRYVSRVFFFS